MKPIRALIVDDEPLAHKIILEYAKDIPNLEIVGQCYLATEALLFLKEQEVDLLFLDINMPKIKGLDFLRLLQQGPMVIITSAYQEYALEGFELEVSDYLLKPFRFDRFLKAVNRVSDWYDLKKETSTQLPKKEVMGRHLFIKSNKRQIQLALEDIYYLESYGNYVKIWMKTVAHLTLKTLASFEEKLPQNEFIRIHKSFIIYKPHIEYIEGNMVKMKNGRVLNIGKNYRAALKSLFR